MLHPTKKDRLLLAAIVGGFLVLSAGAEMIKFWPSFQRLLRNPVPAAAVVLVSALTVTSFILWARQADQPHRVPFTVATLMVGGLAVLFQGLAPAIGWWAGLAIQAPLVMQALLYGLSIMGMIALLLMAYRRLASRKPRLALLVYGLILVGMIPLAVVGDQFALNRGILEFHHGYTIWTDVLYGEFLLGSPLIVYEVTRRLHASTS